MSTPRQSGHLLEVLRDDLGLTGAKYGCGEGRCGACTVLVDGAPVRSCVTKLGAVAAGEITTIEGLGEGREAAPASAGVPGLGCHAVWLLHLRHDHVGRRLLRKNPDPTPDEVIEFMNGNICRCGTYPRIIAALSNAAKAMKEARR